MLNIRIFQHFPRGQAVAAAEYQNVFGARGRLHGGQDEGFVVTGFIARGKLQVAVDVKPRVVFPARNHQPLVGRVAFKYNRVAEVALFGFESDLVGVNKGGGERGEYEKGAQTDGAVAGQLGFEHAGGEVGDGGV